MKWEDLQTSENIEDRRGEPGGGMFGGPSSGGGIGLGTIVILGLIGWALGINSSLLIGGADMLSRMRGGRQVASREDEPRDTARRPTRWATSSARCSAPTSRSGRRSCREQKGVALPPPRLVLFNGVTNSRCGTAQSAMGPFYCPIDQKIYLDTSFFRDMKRRFGGGGDFAYAYVISHEMGHHIENLLGILPKVQRAQQRAGSRGGGQCAVRARRADGRLPRRRLGQQWQRPSAHSSKRATSKRRSLPRRRSATIVCSAHSPGDVVPDSFTHGSSAQRTRWLLRGLQTAASTPATPSGEVSR